MTERTFEYIPNSPKANPWEAALGIHSTSRMGLISQVKGGLPVAAFDRFSQVVGIPRETLARTIHVSTRTVSRRREAGQRLDPTTSERLVRLASLYAKTTEVIGDDGLARQWMQTPREAFAGKTPFEMAETELGAREVEDLLLRIEHGVFY